MNAPAQTGSAAPSSALKLMVAATPLLGSLTVPLLIPLIMVRINIGAGVLAAVLLSCAWFALMLRSSELPSHD